MTDRYTHWNPFRTDGVPILSLLPGDSRQHSSFGLVPPFDGVLTAGNRDFPPEPFPPEGSVHSRGYVTSPPCLSRVPVGLEATRRVHFSMGTGVGDVRYGGCRSLTRPSVCPSITTSPTLPKDLLHRQKGPESVPIVVIPCDATPPTFTPFTVSSLVKCCNVSNTPPYLVLLLFLKPLSKTPEIYDFRNPETVFTSFVLS